MAPRRAPVPPPRRAVRGPSSLKGANCLPPSYCADKVRTGARTSRLQERLALKYPIRLCLRADSVSIRMFQGKQSWLATAALGQQEPPTFPTARGVNLASISDATGTQPECSGRRARRIPPVNPAARRAGRASPMGHLWDGPRGGKINLTYRRSCFAGCSPRIRSLNQPFGCYCLCDPLIGPNQKPALFLRGGRLQVLSDRRSRPCPSMSSSPCSS